MRREMSSAAAIPRWAALRPWPLLLALLAQGALAPGASAQEAVRITEPAAWQAGQTDTIQAGASLHVVGSVRQSSGVIAVLVNGQRARTRSDRGTPELVHFEFSLRPDTSMHEVTVVVEPRVGAPTASSFRLVVLPPGGRQRSGGGPASVPGEADSTAAGRDSVAAGPAMATLPTIEVQLSAPHPWHAYTVRGVGYALLMGAGAYLATVKKTNRTEVCTGPTGQQDCVDRIDVSRPMAGVGVAVAAGAGLVGLLDAALTWRRASARPPVREEQPARARTGFEPPALEADARGARLALVRYRF